MSKLLNLIFFCLLVIPGIFRLPLNAQSVDHKSLTINTNPLGALAELKGDYTILSQTPLFYINDLNGRYQVKISKPGYESWQKTMYFVSGASQSLSISLAQKTRFKTFFRAAAFPGWGHFYSERKAKGLFLGTSFWLSLGYTMIVSNNYSKKLDEYNRMLNNFNALNLNNQEYEIEWQQILSKHGQANAAYKSQKLWLWCTSTIYLVNIVDALIFYPKFQKGAGEHLSYSISADSHGNGAQVALSVKF